MTAAVYTAGQVVECLGFFTDTNSAPVDPTTVAFEFTVTQNGVTSPVTAYTYTGAATPAPGVLARLAAGYYQAQTDTTARPGYWEYVWRSTGVGQATAAANFTVTAPPF